MDSQGAKSVVSDDMQNLGHGAEDISNQASGYKAAISNPSEFHLFKRYIIMMKRRLMSLSFSFSRHLGQGQGGGKEEVGGFGRRGCLLRQDWRDYK